MKCHIVFDNQGSISCVWMNTCTEKNIDNVNRELHTYRQHVMNELGLFWIKVINMITTLLQYFRESCFQSHVAGNGKGVSKLGKSIWIIVRQSVWSSQLILDAGNMRSWQSLSLWSNWKSKLHVYSELVNRNWVHSPKLHGLGNGS